MASHRPPGREPDPIEAEFEASDPVSTETRPRRKRPLPRQLSRSVTLPQLAIASASAALAGAIIAIGVASISAQTPTGTLAQEIDTLSRTQGELTTQAAQASADLVALRGRIDVQAAQLAERETGERATRAELAAIAGQLSGLIGATDGQPIASAATSPLAALLARLDRLDATVTHDAASPQTTPQIQRAIRELSQQVAALDAANVELAAALNQRQAALGALETGLVKTSADILALQAGRPVQPVGDATLAATPGIPTAAIQSRTLQALEGLQTAARRGSPFVNQQRALAMVLPGDRDVTALAEIARKGAPTLDQLRQGFRTSAGRAEDILARQSDDGWNWLRAAVSGVVPLDRPEADRAAVSAIAQAQRAIATGDVRGALDALDTLAPEPARPFARWRDQALRRAELDERLDILGARMLAPSAIASAG